VVGEESAKSIRIKLFAVVCLHSQDGQAELSMNIGKEGTDCGQNLRFLSQGKGPNMVCIIIKKNNIIFATRVT
jgi:hypothetical protein